MKYTMKTLYLTLALVYAVGCTERPTTAIRANDDVAHTMQGQPVIINVLANDFYTPLQGQINTQMSVDAVVQNPVHGSAVVLPSGMIEYTPQSTFTGTDTFTYSLVVRGTEADTGEDFEHSNGVAYKVTVYVEGESNTKPQVKSFVAHIVCNDDNTTIEPLAIDLDGYDDDNDTLTYTITQDPQYGSLLGVDNSHVVTNGNHVTFILTDIEYGAFCENGQSDMFSYKANDSYVDSDEGNITIRRND